MNTLNVFKVDDEETRIPQVFKACKISMVEHFVKIVYDLNC